MALRRRRTSAPFVYNPDQPCSSFIFTSCSVVSVVIAAGVVARVQAKERSGLGRRRF